MYVEIWNEHNRTEEFIQIIQEFFPNAKITRYEVSTYVEMKDRVISYFSCLKHDVVTTLKDNHGDYYEFPLDMFGTIYEL